MNFFKINYILFILIITISFVQFIIIYRNNKSSKVEEELNNQREKIENCIDIENKNKRSIYENIKLSEYCIGNFVTTE